MEKGKNGVKTNRLHSKPQETLRRDCMCSAMTRHDAARHAITNVAVDTTTVSNVSVLRPEKILKVAASF
jgi:hypothetical protein